uniref:Uncharacterized protein n=1 Tax=Physcomitrium patens TaxID=3218 RepID=A0A7I4DFK7_PHYPA
MDSIKQFVKPIEEKGRKHLEKKEALLKWQQKLDERRKRRRHRKHKRSEHSTKHRHGSRSESEENSEDIRSGENKKKCSSRKRSSKYHRHLSESEEDEPLRLSAWRREEQKGSKSDSSDLTDNDRSHSRKSK